MWWCLKGTRLDPPPPPHKVSEIRQTFEWEPTLMNNSFSHALAHILVIQNQVTSGRQKRKDYSLPGYRLGCWGYSREVSIKHFASGLRTAPRKSLCPLDGPFVIYWILRFMQSSRDIHANKSLGRKVLALLYSKYLFLDFLISGIKTGFHVYK